MYSPYISEFSDFLATKDNTLQDILDYLERVTLNIVGCNSIIFFQASTDSEYFMAGKSGVSRLAQEELSAIYSLRENYPVSDAINKGETIWLESSPERLEKYPLLKNFPILVDHHVFIVSPIFRFSTPVSAFAIFSDTKMKANVEAEEFLTAICSIFSLYYYRTGVALPQEPKKIMNSDSNISHDESPELTGRQNLILQLISEDRTNSNISESLGYSESTIRQEIMRIFVKLGCSTRSQAAEIYRKLKKD